MDGRPFPFPRLHVLIHEPANHIIHHLYCTGTSFFDCENVSIRYDVKFTCALYFTVGTV